MSSGWFRVHRSEELAELIRGEHDALILALVIATRAQWSTRFNRHNLALGEALLGDYREYGMTEKRYRNAKSKLERWGFATFRGANKGTVAKLNDCRLFDVILGTGGEQKGEQDGEPRADDGRTTGGQGATTDNRESERTDELVLGEVVRPASAKASRAQLPLDDDGWLKSLESDATYSGLNIRAELGKMRRWCEANRRQPTRKRFVNWLNRIDRPIQPTAPSGTDYSKGF